MTLENSTLIFLNARKHVLTSGLKFLITIASLLACDMTDPIHFDVQPELRTYVNQFFREASSRKAVVQRQDLTISIKGLSKESAAWGMTYFKNPIEVVIDKDFYTENCGTQEGRLRIEYIVFHEFGHALLGRPHVDSNSVMNFKTERIRYYATNSSSRKVLIDELFANGRR